MREREEGKLAGGMRLSGKEGRKEGGLRRSD